MYILAFDPGRTVGWAAFRKPNNRDGYASGQIKDDHVWGFLESSKIQAYDATYPTDITHIIVESFKYRQLPKADLTPVEVIGVIKEWCRQNEVDISFQTPAQAKGFWTDDRLKAQELYRPSKPHANDAMRHLMYYLNFGRGVHLGERVEFTK